eukprot:CAMPEP_0172442830 /NCGR_PEP_ID=MMETSP1065-20121228/3217_1 /TAXON_ID=265537 /ORGANISM="Amphiprora paludosa, Strain CCMP125" /LENGTH=111 /DNA_ID=CAMNT_0013192871 /DNA_START=53 /DNA_END=388 /DNA_ORIENTATION=-
MTFTELDDQEALSEFLSENKVCVVTFSATWCGPCKASKPRLNSIANEESCPLPIGYVHEDDLDDFLDSYPFMEVIRAFPTYVCFEDGKEVERVEGVNLEGLNEMMSKRATA